MDVLLPASSCFQLPATQPTQPLVWSCRWPWIFLALWGVASLTLGLAAEESSSSKPVPASLVLTDLRLDPSSPDPDTLCKLWVTIRNDTDQVASLLHLRVRLNDQDVGRYASDSFVVRVDPGTSQEVRLFNVWSSETGRPPASDGRLEAEVTLEAATWVEIDAPKDGGPEVWTPSGPVPGLPASLRRLVTRGSGETP